MLFAAFDEAVSSVVQKFGHLRGSLGRKSNCLKTVNKIGGNHAAKWVHAPAVQLVELERVSAFEWGIPWLLGFAER